MGYVPATERTAEKIRNIAIIAHVDHGKTTLVDKLLGQSGSFKRGEDEIEQALDSGELERERGITILSKCTSLEFDGYHINVVDTPGHADFGGEVERVMHMVDSALLLVDAFEGPMPQTRFVTQKALARGLHPIVVINKIDRPGCDPQAAADAVLDLFISLGATEKQCEFPVIFASAKLGYTQASPDDEPGDLTPLLKKICEHVPAPMIDPQAAPAMQVATFDHDGFVGSMAIGRVESGVFRPGEHALMIRHDGSRDEFRINQIFGFRGLHRLAQDQAVAGDIVAITGMEAPGVGETLTSVDNPRVLPMIQIDAPTVKIAMMTNTSPTCGKEGKFVTSAKIAERLEREKKSNVSMRVETTDSPDSFNVIGRGELHLSVLIETMRREGYEFMVSRPKVVTKTDESGETLEPYEIVTADVQSVHVGTIIESLSQRFGRIINIRDVGEGRTRVEFVVPTRGLIGYRSRFLTETRGTGVFNAVFHEYGPWAGEIADRVNGAMIALEDCTTVAYALWKLEDRGVFFMGSGTKVYAGQIVGWHTRDNDLVINPGKAKRLSNVRSAGADEKNFVKPHKVLSIEEAIEFINDDELVEFTPRSIRVRKRILDHNDRKHANVKADNVTLDQRAST
ncbi:MAG: translational GTPase TypA [Candidatus Alcyoniella australis]|nr:translational GTPase TypA [Candidatus Alcyoniella australis]